MEVLKRLYSVGFFLIFSLLFLFSAIAYAHNATDGVYELQVNLNDGASYNLHLLLIKDDYTSTFNYYVRTPVSQSETGSTQYNFNSKWVYWGTVTDGRIKEIVLSDRKGSEVNPVRLYFNDDTQDGTGYIYKETSYIGTFKIVRVITDGMTTYRYSTNADYSQINVMIDPACKTVPQYTGTAQFTKFPVEFASEADGWFFGMSLTNGSCIYTGKTWVSLLNQNIISDRFTYTYVNERNSTDSGVAVFSGQIGDQTISSVIRIVSPIYSMSSQSNLTVTFSRQ